MKLDKEKNIENIKNLLVTNNGCIYSDDELTI